MATPKSPHDGPGGDLVAHHVSGSCPSCGPPFRDGDDMLEVAEHVFHPSCVEPEPSDPGRRRVGSTLAEWSKAIGRGLAGRRSGTKQGTLATRAPGFALNTELAASSSLVR